MYVYKAENKKSYFILLRALTLIAKLAGRE